MSTLFGKMTPREVTAIKMKIPIAKSFERHHDQLQHLTQSSTVNITNIEKPLPKSSYDLTIEDIRHIFRS